MTNEIIAQRVDKAIKLSDLLEDAVSFGGIELHSTDAGIIVNGKMFDRKVGRAWAIALIAEKMEN